MSSTLNQLTIGKSSAGAKLLEFFKETQPGDRIKITLDNGVSKLTGEVIVDENLDDRMAGRVKMEDGEKIGSEEDEEEDDDEESKPAPSSGSGASVMAVIAGAGKKS